MKRVCLIHSKAAERKARIELLDRLGYDVLCEPVAPALLGKLRSKPPDAVVIDLSRAVAQGRDVALALRNYKKTRSVPLVFAGGERAKVAGVKQLLPDAVYSSWARIRSALEKAIAAPHCPRSWASSRSSR